MITFSPDFQRLIGHDANGNEFSHSFAEGASYAAMATTRSQQIQADTENTRAVQDYLEKLSQANALALAGKPYMVPEKPLRRIVLDTGAVLTEAFLGLPILPAPPPPATSIPGPDANSPWGHMGGGASVDVNARDTRQFEMIQDLWNMIVRPTLPK